MATKQATKPAPRSTAKRARSVERETARAARPEETAPPAPPQSPVETPPVAVEAGESILGANPFVGLNVPQVLAAFGRLLTRLGAQPRVVLRHTAALAAELTRVVLGRSEIEPAKSDKRWADPAYVENPAYHRVEQAYLAVCRELDAAIGEAGLDEKSTARARFAASIVTEALAPTNTLPGNPAALKRTFDTAGLNLVRGARHFVSDLVTNRGMPTQVDTRPFRIGETIAATPGAVVFRNEVLEILQYAPTTPVVHRRPTVYVPPQINKYYVLDLAPGRSFAEYVTSRGVPFFAVSFRNPTPEHRDWDVSTYVGAILEGIDAVREVTGSEDVNLMGLCAGGMTSALLLGHLAATGDRKVASATFIVTMLDTAQPSTIGMFASEQSVATAVAKSRRQGVHRGSDMARMFSWLRPNELVWNYWVNNYLMGKEPPAFDILAWNGDSTELPAALHAEFLDMFLHNGLRQPGGLTVLGTPVDLSKVDVDAYVVGGLTDHITPWKATYQTTQILSGRTTFVLSSSGHVQSLVNPPGNPKASFWTGGEHVADPDEWKAAASAVKGSWWEHWVDWATEHSGGERPAPATPGSAAHPPIEPAPGSYVRRPA